MIKLKNDARPAKLRDIYRETMGRVVAKYDDEMLAGYIPVMDVDNSRCLRVNKMIVTTIKSIMIFDPSNK